MKHFYSFTDLQNHVFAQPQPGVQNIQGLSTGMQQILIMNICSSINEANTQFSLPKTILVVLQQEKNITPWMDFLQNSLSKNDLASLQILPYPTTSWWGIEQFRDKQVSCAQRMRTLSSLLFPNSRQIVFTTMAGLCQKTIHPDTLKANHLWVEKHHPFNFEGIMSSLDNFGYEEVETVNNPATYAVRGSIIDIFSTSAKYPVRISLDKHRVDKLAEFFPSEQRSYFDIERFPICLAREYVLDRQNQTSNGQILYDFLLESGVERYNREGMMRAFQDGFAFPGLDLFGPLFRKSAPFLEYLKRDSWFVFPEGMLSCNNQFHSKKEMWKFLNQESQDSNKINFPVSRHFCDGTQMLDDLSNFPILNFSDPDQTKFNHSFILNSPKSRPQSPPPSYQKGEKRLKFLLTQFTQIIENTGAVVILCQNSKKLSRLEILLSHNGFSPQRLSSFFKQLFLCSIAPENLHLCLGTLAEPVWIEDQQIFIIPDSSIFQYESKFASSSNGKSRRKQKFDAFHDLNPEDLVVHMEHGVGQYKGLETMNLGSSSQDFLIIEYAANDKLYLPVDNLDRLQKYRSGNSIKKPQLDSLKGQGWQKRKIKATKNIEDIAAQLLQSQAQRSVTKRKPFCEPTDDYFTFESEFPHLETEDQLKALEDIQADLAAELPMDRLICGDVGFGKTEIAIRTVYRTLLEGFQCIVLAPTTVLCFQHYQTFKQRLQSFGVNVRQLNRFIPNKQASQTKHDLAAGKIDVLIGTHRILAKDLVLKNPGLIVIDEEQRFGVKHKEKLKSLGSGINILCLSATPIPRSLHMSMIGLRDISIVATPPVNRLPIRTYISSYDEHIIKNAITKEIQRGGQVFYVLNRVENILNVKKKLQHMLPDLRIGIAHGQMPENQLEKTIFDFLGQKYSLLLCTTIIESGIDMPNVNTLIVQNAERFGLAQLYQLRGRVGRSARQSQTYLMTGENQLTDKAKQRLEILSTHQDLGSGLKIAQHDLELRGAGNLLGAQQSGLAFDVGIEMFTKLLEQSIRNLKGEPSQENREVEIKIPIPAGIPQTFMKSENQRVVTYKKIFSAATGTELDKIKHKIIDQYGNLPEKTENTFKVAEMRICLKSIGGKLITLLADHSVEITFHPLTAQTLKTILEIAKQTKHFNLTPEFKLIVAADSISQEKKRHVNIDNIIRAIYPIVQLLEETP